MLALLFPGSAKADVG